MKRVFIIHRWSGGSKDDWRPWLKLELEKIGYEVIIPDMPNTERPVIEKWVNHIAKIVGQPDGQTYFIGHSIGCQAILRYLERIEVFVGGAVFVAGWFNLENLEDEEVGQIAKPWISTPINLQKVRQVLSKSVLIISNNDPYGAFEENKNKFNELGSKIVVLDKAGHIRKEDGFAEARPILEEFKKIE